MGNLSAVKCDDCGYATKVVFGGSMTSSREDWVKPFSCFSCREVVAVRCSHEPVACPVCGARDMLPLNYPPHRARLPERMRLHRQYLRDWSQLAAFTRSPKYAETLNAGAPDVAERLLQWDALPGPREPIYREVAELRRALRGLFPELIEEDPPEDPPPASAAGLCPVCRSQKFFFEGRGILFD